MNGEFDDELWNDLHPFMFPESSFRTAEEEVERIIAMTGLDSGAVLDLACGPGRHSVPFAAKGFMVTGVDLSPFLLESAKKYADSANVAMEWIQEDMRRFRRPGSFHLALSLYSSFGFFEKHQENMTVLRNTFLNLMKDGMLVMDLPGREVLAGDFRPELHFKVARMGYVAEHRNVTPDWKRLFLSWEIDGESRPRRRLSFRLWLYSGQELREMLERAGFSGISLYGGFDLRPYDESARQLIALAFKR